MNWYNIFGTVRNYFDLRRGNPPEDVVEADDPDDIQVMISDLLVTGIDVNFNEEILAYVLDDGDYAVDYVAEDGTPIFESFDDPYDAAGRFLELRNAGILTSPKDTEDPESQDYVEVLFEEEMTVLRQLFDNMRLESGRTVTEELSDIENAPYVLDFKPADGQIRLDEKSWLILVDKIKALVKS